VVSGSFRTPLREIVNAETQVTGYQPVIWMTVLRDPLPPERERFILDSGASVSVMSVARAEDLQLPLPGPEAEVELAHQTADTASPVRRRVRPGRLHIQIPAIRDEPFDWPCYFRPDLPKETPPLLGLAGVLEDLRLTLDGVRSRGGVFFGYLLLELRSAPATPEAATPPSP
jgi:hypothetical protein